MFFLVIRNSSSKSRIGGAALIRGLRLFSRRVLRRYVFFRRRYQIVVNHQEVSKGSSLKRSFCMPVCCDQGNEFEYEGHVIKLVFGPWFSRCFIGDLCLFFDGNIAQDGRTSSIIHKALVWDIPMHRDIIRAHNYKGKTLFGWKWSKRFAFYSPFHMRSIRTHAQRDFEEER